nr:RNA polymerase-binding protein RbpA [Nocardioides perillae]
MTRRALVAGGGNAIRGSRVGAGPMGEAERGEAAPRQLVTYFCSHDHRSVVAFSTEAQVPESWDCPKCGLPASLDCDNPPPAPKIEPYKTHLAYVKERRSDAEAAEILDEALNLLRSRRKSGDIVF